MPRRRFALAATIAAVLAAPAAANALQASPALGDRPVAGASGAGDPFFPQAGNGGYDAIHYSLAIDYDPAPVNRLSGRATVVAWTTETLSRFNLDLRDSLTVTRVTVNGRAATFAHAGQELSITPRRRLRSGRPFVTTVAYGGSPQAITDPDGSADGWIPTDDGAFVAGEPQGAPSWFPVNDTPRDKATYDIAVTLPAGRTAMGNGLLVARHDHGSRTTSRWFERKPMAPYLVTATNGIFETRSNLGGLPTFDAVDPNTRVRRADPPNPALAWERLAPEREIVHFFAGLYGPYPFESIGGIVDWAPDVGYALESQTRVNYDRIPSASTVVHEIAHQWFGNAVTLERWPDIWLHEGFATWSEWIYDERHDGPTAQERFDELYAIDPATDEGKDLWVTPPAALPGPEVMFSTPVYDRGAMTLQALRQRVGDDTFFRILRAWYRQHRFGNATTGDFIALAQRRSGLDLRGFFDAWLFTEGRPSTW
jgi:aminopeptidase N